MASAEHFALPGGRNLPASPAQLGSRALRRWEFNRHQRLVVRQVETQEDPPTIFILAPDYDVPSGGIKVIYRHADVLNDLGIRARVLHRKRGFRCSWFPNSTLIANTRDTRLGPSDLLVVTELDIDVVTSGRYRGPHVVLNQSGWLTWSNAGEHTTLHMKSPDGPRGIITVSEFTEDLLSYAFPGIPVMRVSPSIDTEVFHPAAEPPEGKVISYMHRRGAPDVRLAAHILESHGALGGWELRAIDGLSQAGVAEELRRSRIFLTGSLQEGFGLPPVEAMACGNYVVGYHAMGGREFLDPSWSSPVESGDALALARALEAAVEAEAAQPGYLWERGMRASAHVRDRYSSDRDRAQIGAAYSRFLDADPVAGVLAAGEVGD